MKKKTVQQQFLDNPEDFDLHQALRILEKMKPGTLSPGETAMLDSELVAFRSSIDYKFPVSVIKDLKLDESNNHVMEVTHLGLAGAHGSLPLYVTDLVLEQEKRGEPILRDFLDIFNHRLVSIHSRVRRKYRPAYTNDEPSRSPANKVLYSLVGLGHSTVRNKMRLHDEELIPFTGMLSGEQASKSVYECMIAEFCNAKVRIDDFRGEWVTIDKSELTTIGEKGLNTELGVNAICGSRAFNPIASCKIYISELQYERYAAIRPGGREYGAFTDLIRFLFNDTMNIVVNMQLQHSEIPQPFMTSRGVQLGHFSWIGELNTLDKYSSEFHFSL
ncbi:MAG: type VI secretion system baseplate subunit TssG [Candidatus Kapaibacterium sp.]